jgi:hypothetical protein
MKRALVLAVFLLAGRPCLAQDNSFPSKEEISELAHKADEKVTAFEQAVRTAKPFMPEERFKIDMDTASTAHLLIGTLIKNGPSAYRLVALVITLDDVVIDADLSSQEILKTGLSAASTGKAVSMDSLGAVIVLNTAATACDDISELIGHATLRLISAEEKILEQAAK